MQGNLFTPTEPLYPLEYVVEVVEDAATLKELKYYVGTSEFGDYVVLLNKNSILELELTHDTSAYIDGIDKRYPEAKITQAKNWDLAKKLFVPAKYDTIPQININLYGTEFQIKVWNELLKIPFGQTISYDDIAVTLGDKNASRAVGTAVGQNKIAYLVPCHRVVAKNGKLSNFRWGIERKKQLLSWEYSLTTL
ncbi:MAG: MGMT family protein [Sphingobacteriales bacterium JAD_PAG50586_3]|nr:MAG: MGMT family protein [Sphingobacteriales bacterium JAD_PAG50586_3]